MNGQILTGEEERNAEYLQKVQERYAGLEQITESGCYTLYNMEKGTNEDIVVNYDQATGKIVGLYHEALQHSSDIPRKSKARRWKWR